MKEVASVDSASDAGLLITLSLKLGIRGKDIDGEALGLTKTISLSNRYK